MGSGFILTRIWSLHFGPQKAAGRDAHLKFLLHQCWARQERSGVRQTPPTSHVYTWLGLRRGNVTGREGTKQRGHR